LVNGKKKFFERAPGVFNDFFQEWAFEEHETHVHTRDGFGRMHGKNAYYELRLYVLLITGFAGKLC